LISFMILFFANSSGGHFNSLISMAAASTGRISLTRCITYGAVQTFGWFIGAQAMRAVVTPKVASESGLGGCFTGGKSPGALLVVDLICSLLLVCSIYGTAWNAKQGEIYGRILPPLIIGTTLGLLIFASGSLNIGAEISFPYTGAGMNPSMCYGIDMSYSAIEHHPYPTFPTSSVAYFFGPVFAVMIHSFVYYVAPPHFDSKND